MTQQPATFPGTRHCHDVQRTTPAGGDVAARILHPDFTPWERLYRRLPPPGLTQAQRNQPVQFEILGSLVPKDQALVIAEYEFQLFRFSGLIPGEAVPLETQRLSNSVAYDINVSGFRRTNVSYGILPTEVQAENQASQVVAPINPGFPTLRAPSQQIGGSQSIGTGSIVVGSGGLSAANVPGANYINSLSALITTSQTAANAAQSSLQNLSSGSASLPQEQRRMGALSMPFSLIVRSNDAVQMKVAFYEPILVPLAFVQARFSGFLMPSTNVESFLQGVKPCF